MLVIALFGYLSGLLPALAEFPYVRDILLRKTKPQRSTWFIYSTLGSIAFFSQLSEGASHSLWLTGVSTFAEVIVFLLSFKYGVGGFSKKDYVALCIVGLGLIAWYITKEAAIALYVVIMIDMTGTYLTLDKTYKDPSSETRISWILSTLAGFFGMLAVGSWNLVLLSYPFYTFIANASIIAAIELGKRNNARKNKRAD